MKLQNQVLKIRKDQNLIKGEKPNMMIKVEVENGMMVLTGKTQKDQKTIKHLIDQDQEGTVAHHKVVQDQGETGIEIGITEKEGNAKFLMYNVFNLLDDLVKKNVLKSPYQSLQ